MGTNVWSHPSFNTVKCAKEGDEWQDESGSHGGALAIERVKPRLRRPRLYKVIMLNDDYTPMDFVVHVLEAFFNMHREQATRIMIKVHTEGRAVCGIYSRDVAETKAEQVNLYSHQNEHPLLCNIEASDLDDED